MTTPVFDAGSQGFTSGAASLTISHTVGSGSDRALVVWATCINSTDFLAAATVTYGGVSMGSPVVTPAAGASNNYIYCWVLKNPTSGTANIVITPSAGAYIKAVCSSWDTVDQTTPVAATNKANTGFAGSPYTNSISGTGHMAIDFLCLRNASKALTPDGTQTRIGSQVAGTLSSSSGSYKAGATTMSWTQPDPGTAPVAWGAIALAGAAGGTDATGTGAIAAVTLTAPTGTASGSGNATGTGPIAAVTLTAPTGSASTSGAGNATGDIAAVTLTAPTGTATGGTSGAGTVALGPLKNNTGTVLASETGITVHVYATTGALVVTKTGQTSNGSGVCTVVDAAMSPSTAYRCVIVLGSGAEGMVTVTAA